MPKPPSRGAVTSAFGMRTHPITGVYRMHYGEDTIGDGNRAPVTGVVVFSGYDTTGHGFGNVVGIREDAHPDRIWWTAHHARLDIRVGTRTVENVTPTGPLGMTGAATGPHAHQECRVGGIASPGSGTAINPRPLYTAGDGGTDGHPTEEEMLMSAAEEIKDITRRETRARLFKNLDTGERAAADIKTGYFRLNDAPDRDAQLANWRDVYLITYDTADQAVPMYETQWANLIEECRLARAAIAAEVGSQGGVAAPTAAENAAATRKALIPDFAAVPKSVLDLQAARLQS